jgi:cytochrome c1
VVLVAACAPTSQPAAPAPAPTGLSAEAQQGQQLMAQKGCGACHTIPGVAGATGNIGPGLAGVATRATIAGGAVPNNGPADLQRWILDPPTVKPGTQMPKLGLTEQEAQQMVAYLENLR